jgi:hypothetical protein
VRAALYMAALVATRHNRSIRTFYERLLAQNNRRNLRLLPACESSLSSSTRWPGRMSLGDSRCEHENKTVADPLLACDG